MNVFDINITSEMIDFLIAKRRNQYYSDRKHSWVYILFNGDIPVYVGTSFRIHRRISDHIRDGKKFDSVSYLRGGETEEAWIIYILQGVKGFLMYNKHDGCDLDFLISRNSIIKRTCITCYCHITKKYLAYVSKPYFKGIEKGTRIEVVYSFLRNRCLGFNPSYIKMQSERFYSTMIPCSTL